MLKDIVDQTGKIIVDKRDALIGNRVELTRIVSNNEAVSRVLFPEDMSKKNLQRTLYGICNLDMLLTIKDPYSAHESITITYFLPIELDELQSRLQQGDVPFLLYGLEKKDDVYVTDPYIEHTGTTLDDFTKVQSASWDGKARQLYGLVQIDPEKLKALHVEMETEVGLVSQALKRYDTKVASITVSLKQSVR